MPEDRSSQFKFDDDPDRPQTPPQAQPNAAPTEAPNTPGKQDADGHVTSSPPSSETSSGKGGDNAAPSEPRLSEDSVSEDQDPATQASDESVDELTQLKTQLAEVRASLVQAEQRVLRANADYQNMARRSQQNIAFARNEQIMNMAKPLLNVMDHFDQALQLDPEKSDFASLLQGVQIVRDELMRVLESFDVKRIETHAGDNFDPAIHEAMMKQPSEDIPANHITRQLQPGYQIRDKILRPAKVIVAQ